MAKIGSIHTVSSGYLSMPQINENFTTIVDAFANTLSLDGSTPNSMAADLDMNGNQILNAVFDLTFDDIDGVLTVAKGGTGRTTIADTLSDYGFTTFGKTLVGLSDVSALTTLLGVSGVSDGDKGDIVVSSTGSVWTIDSSVLSSFGRTLIDDVSASAARTTLGLGTLATQSGTFSGTSSGINTGDQDLSSYLTSATAASTYVPLTRTINSQALSGNITLTTANIADSLNKRYVTDANLTTLAATSGTNTGDQTITLTGDVTGTGTGSFAATIGNGKVTLAKIANASASSKLLGAGSAGSGSAYTEITLGTNLTMSGTTLNASGGSGSAPYVDTTAVSNTGGSATNLITYNLPANTLSSNGKVLRITVWGTVVNNANTKTVTLNFGSTVLKTNTVLTSSTNTWKIQAYVIRTGSNAQIYSSTFDQTGGAGASGVALTEDSGTSAQTDSSTITIKCTGNSTTTNDITQKALIVEVLG